MPIFVRQMTTRLLFFLGTTLTLSSYTFGQTVKGQFTADSVFIYKNFKQHGTTANLGHNHKDLDSANAQKIKLSAIDLAELIDIFKASPRKKLFQQKYGGDICYVIVYDKGQKKRFVLLASQDYGVLDDLDTMKRWILSDADTRKRFYKLVRKNWL
jgi:hypothetical protein